MAICDDFIHCDCSSIVKKLQEKNKELLEALEQIANRDVPVVKEEHRIARAAIAKAKGEGRE